MLGFAFAVIEHNASLTQRNGLELAHGGTRCGGYAAVWAAEGKASEISVSKSPSSQHRRRQDCVTEFVKYAMISIHFAQTIGCWGSRRVSWAGHLTSRKWVSLSSRSAAVVAPATLTTHTKDRITDFGNGVDSPQCCYQYCGNHKSTFHLIRNR